MRSARTRATSATTTSWSGSVTLSVLVPRVKPEDLAREQRRRQREGALVFGKARSFDEHARQGELFWRDVDPGLKLEAIVELIRDSWYLQGRDGPPPRLDRSAHGVRKLRG
ncbi:MAG: hypothetical protein BGO98_11235 [Myxococcales bacterium 68-20]|nr:MAG: hypothetical protein BGO98_11235 [Myxococcales bacterium 68-20]